jgi:hypothetical protein
MNGWSRSGDDGASTSEQGWRKSKSDGAVISAIANVYLVDCTLSAVTLDLPAIAGNVGRIFIVSKVDSTGNAVTIDPSGAETINGAGTDTLASQYSTMTLLCTETGWIRLAEI